jgi:hypothetical protein
MGFYEFYRFYKVWKVWKVCDAIRTKIEII